MKVMDKYAALTKLANAEGELRSLVGTLSVYYPSSPVLTPSVLAERLAFESKLLDSSKALFQLGRKIPLYLALAGSSKLGAEIAESIQSLNSKLPLQLRMSLTTGMELTVKDIEG